VGRKPEANPCTEEHEPRIRRGDLGELAQEGEARHHRQGRHVDAAGAGGKWSFLSGEVCLGAGCAVVVAAPTARVVRCGQTGQKSAEVVVLAGDRIVAGKGRTSGETEESVLLVPAALIAAIPRTRASCGEETVSSVEHRS
jgi:hypothetical protein